MSRCPLNSRTLALGSVEFGDCGCEENYINVGSEGKADLEEVLAKKDLPKGGGASIGILQESFLLPVLCPGNLTCAVCQVGLSCPFMGTEKSFSPGHFRKPRSFFFCAYVSYVCSYLERIDFAYFLYLFAVPSVRFQNHRATHPVS